jgi:hypothetical protein
MNKDTTNDIVILKTSGYNPLKDFPHARFHCVVIPFQLSDSNISYQSCPNCWCYACDVPVKSCTSWDTHCFAHSSDSKWSKFRERTLSKRKKDLNSDTLTSNSQQEEQPPAVIRATKKAKTVIPAGTPHGIHAEHLHDVNYSTEISNTTRVVIPQVRDPKFHRFSHGIFCECYTRRQDGIQLLDGYDSLDGIYKVIDFHDFINIKKHSAVNGRGVPFHSHILSDFETCWQCKRCGYPPPIDVNFMLNQQRKAYKNQLRH